MKKIKCNFISLLILLAIYTFIDLYQNLDYNNKLLGLYTTNAQIKGKTDGFSVKQDRNEKYVTNTHLKGIADDVSVKRYRSEKYVTNTHIKRIADDVSVKRDRNNRYSVQLQKTGGVQIKLDRTQKYNWSYTGQLNADYKPFAPAINTTEYTMLLDLIKRVKDAFETFDITYMLEGGSGLGSYRHHGIIPWDDDIDLTVNISQQKMLKKALEDIPGHTLHSPNNSLWKFFNNNFARAGQSEYKWPVIDIFFFQVNETHVNDVTPNMFLFSDPKSDILPLENGIFEGMVFPVPRHMEAYLNRRYTLRGQCLSTQWSHRTESQRNSFRMPCHKLFGVYPVVHQFQVGNTTFEELRLGNKVLYTVERSSLKLLTPITIW